MARKTTTTTTVTTVTDEEQGDSRPRLYLVVDRSGSMWPQWHDTTKALRRFLKEQKAIAGLRLTLVVFDHEYEVVVNDRPIGEVKGDIFEHYPPRGTTALFDAVGRAASAAEAKHLTGKVLLAVLTDGKNNASREWTREQVSQLIERLRTKEGWAVLFLGEEESAWSAAAMGFGHGIRYSHGASGQTITAVSSTVSDYYGTQSIEEAHAFAATISATAASRGVGTLVGGLPGKPPTSDHDETAGAPAGTGDRSA